MNFSIEVPGEANPLTNQNLYLVLQSASSSDQQQVKTGTQQLSNWEKSAGFYSSLQSLYIDFALPVEVRYLAIIQIKNGIEKYWHKTASNAVRKEEKALIRSRCLQSCIQEPDHRLALQNCLVIARIIRFEYPNEWPDGIVSILDIMRASSRNPLQLSRIMLVLLHVIKELSRAKLQRSRISLQSATPEIVDVLSGIYQEKVKIWLSFLESSGDDEGGALESLDQSLLTLRVLRRLIIAGYDFPNRHQEIRDIWNELANHFIKMLILIQARAATIHINPRSLIEKHLAQISKLHVSMAREHPAGYALLPRSVDIARAYWSLIQQLGQNYGSSTVTPTPELDHSEDGSEETRATTFEKLGLRGLLLIRACVKTVFNPAQSFRYQQAQDKEEKKTSREILHDGLLSDSFVKEVMEALVVRFFVFTTGDLRDWQDTPAFWEERQEASGEDWEVSIRTCAEKLFLDLIIHYRELLIKSLLPVFAQVSSLQSNDILLKDSIYTAIGLAAPVLHKETDFDFGHFLESTLVQEIQIQRAGYNILRRRAAILLGQWLPVKEGLNRPLVYQIFQHLLHKGDALNDEAVRITAGRQLKNIIDPFEFAAAPFMPYAASIFNDLMALIEDVDNLSTKMALLLTVTTVVTRLEQNIIPLAGQIISLLTRIWYQAGEDYLIKQSIFEILAALITSMQEQSHIYHPLVLSLIDSSMDPDSITSINLLEETLDLWATVLVQTPSPGTETLTLLHHLLPLLEFVSENLRKALEITELYILLTPNELLNNASVILGRFATLLGMVKREASGLITSQIELFIRSADYVGGSVGVRELTSVLLSSDLLSILISGLHGAFLAHETTGPNRAIPPIDGIVETDYFTIFARLAIADPLLFISALEAAVSRTEMKGTVSLEQTIEWFLTEWCAHLDNISHIEHKKLSCLALTSLLDLGQPWILVRLQSLMTVWTDVIIELVIDVSMDEGVTNKRDFLLYTDPDAAKEPAETLADERRRKLNFQDPVHRIDIRSFVQDKLIGAIKRCGGMEAFSETWLQNVDKDVVNAFVALGLV